MQERTLVLLKPDAVFRGLVGEIISRFERKGLQMRAAKLVRSSRKLLEKHYIDHKDKPFFEGLLEFMMSGPILAMVWEGPNGTVHIVRQMIGEASAFAEPGTIRGDLAVHTRQNLIHAADSREAAIREINLWFTKDELV